MKKPTLQLVGSNDLSKSDSMKSLADTGSEEFDLRYVNLLYGRQRWCPSPAMKEHGFRFISFGTELSVENKQTITALNRQADLAKFGYAYEPNRYRDGSVGAGYARALKLRDLTDKQHKRVRTKDELLTDHMIRAWKWLEVFADDNPDNVTPEQLIELQISARERVSDHEAYMVIKVWRKLWKQFVRFGMTEKEDPSLAFTNPEPKSRNEKWHNVEVVEMVERGWAAGYYGLATCIAIGWDGLLSSGDTRLLTLGQLRRFPGTDHLYFDLSRIKTSVAAAGTLTEWSEGYLYRYLNWLKSKGIEPGNDGVLFYTSGSKEDAKPVARKTADDSTPEAVLAVLANGPLDRAAIVRAVLLRRPRAKLRHVDVALHALRTKSKKVMRRGTLYLLNPNPPPDAAIGKPWQPVPYTETKLQQDFRVLRTLVFGKEDRRRFHDMRRSGGIEGIAGGGTFEQLGSKLANSLKSNEKLRKTYTPVDVVSVLNADVARKRGRELLPKPGEIVVSGMDLLNEIMPKLLPPPEDK